MSEPFIGQITIFGFNFAPRGWAFCNGQLLPIAQNTALFSLLGTTFGGDGRTTFGLPNLEGRAALHPGPGPGLTTRRLGEIGGTETETLSEAQMANHDHALNATLEGGDRADPEGRWIGSESTVYAADTNSLAAMAATSLPSAGTGPAPHNNMQPYLALNFCIALVGTFPSRS